MKTDSDFLQVVVEVSHALPAEVVEATANLLLSLEPQDVASGQHGRHRLTQLVTQAKAQQQLTRLWKAWQKESSAPPPAAVAWALRSAHRMAQWQEHQQQLELVWTGPSPHESHLRRTDQALLHLIGAAQQSLWLVTFAAYRIPAVAQALEAAAARGVAIHFVAESSEESGGRMTWGAIEALGGHLPQQTAVYIWPREQRPPNEAGQRGALHAKCAVADENLALISSANLTEHALNLNIELGVLVSGTEVAGAIVEHLRRLIEAQILRRIA